MKKDNIVKVIIDDNGRLCVYPENERFAMIYRSAAEVHWDDNGLFLYSPKPREWSYVDWFRHITSVVKDEYNCDLLLTDNTLWINISTSLKGEISAA